MSARGSKLNLNVDNAPSCRFDMLMYVDQGWLRVDRGIKGSCPALQVPGLALIPHTNEHSTAYILAHLFRRLSNLYQTLYY